MDCEACAIVKTIKIENRERKIGQYGSPDHTTMVQSCRACNNVVATKAHQDAAFGHHAEGVLADYYIGQILRTDLGSPPAILDYKIDCSVEELKSVSLGFNVLY